MSKLHYKFCASIGFVLLPSAALAASEPEQTITTISEMLAYGSVLFVVVVGALVYFVRLQDAGPPWTHCSMSAKPYTLLRLIPWSLSACGR